jgi:hypothetical protein
MYRPARSLPEILVIDTDVERPTFFEIGFWLLTEYYPSKTIYIKDVYADLGWNLDSVDFVLLYASSDAKLSQITKISGLALLKNDAEFNSFKTEVESRGHMREWNIFFKNSKEALFKLNLIGEAKIGTKGVLYIYERNRQNEENF